MRALALVAALSITGCSFAFVSGPPTNHQQLPYFECSSSRVAPVLDTLFAVLQVLNLGVLASKSDAEFDAQFDNNDPPLARKTNMGLNVALGALGAAGAYYGFTKTAECRAAKNGLILRSTGMQPQPYGPGAWPPPAAPAPAPAPPAAPDPAPEPAPAPN